MDDVIFFRSRLECTIRCREEASCDGVMFNITNAVPTPNCLLIDLPYWGCENIIVTSLMSAMSSPITNITIVYSTVYSGANQRKYQSSASLALVRGIHPWPVNSFPTQRGKHGKCSHLMMSSWNGHLLWGDTCKYLFRKRMLGSWSKYPTNPKPTLVVGTEQTPRHW